MSKCCVSCGARLDKGRFLFLLFCLEREHILQGLPRRKSRFCGLCKLAQGLGPQGYQDVFRVLVQSFTYFAMLDRCRHRRYFSHVAALHVASHVRREVPGRTFENTPHHGSCYFEQLRHICSPCLAFLHVRSSCESKPPQSRIQGSRLDNRCAVRECH